MTKFVKCFPVASFLLACFLGFSSVKAADALTIGSDAPALNVEHWVQDGKGKFKPVTKFEPGKVYVVEFWATWCGPCVASMPHLAELQNRFADKGVQIVSISDEDLETVESFLERPVRGQPADAEEKKTYRDLTSAYCLTTDPDESSSEDYMRAAGQNGIPTSFIVGKDSKIEWIGHPMELDDTLSAVVEGTWDRAKFAADFKAQQDFELGMNKLMQFAMTKKIDEATAQAKELFKAVEDKPAMVNAVAWNLFQVADQGRIEKDGELIKTSIAATAAAIDKADKTEVASLMDTLAHLYFATGDLDKALEIELQAAKLAGDDDREFIEAFLTELKAAKEEAGKEKPAEDK